MLSFRAGEDVLYVFPTGAGKSLCYQLPALLSKGKSLGFGTKVFVSTAACHIFGTSSNDSNGLPSRVTHSNLDTSDKQRHGNKN